MWIFKPQKKIDKKIFLFTPWFFSNLLSFVFSEYKAHALGGLSEAFLNTAVIFIAYDILNSRERLRKFVYTYFFSIFIAGIINWFNFDYNFPSGIGYRGAGSFLAISYLIPFLLDKKFTLITYILILVYVASIFLILNPQRFALAALVVYVIYFIITNKLLRIKILLLIGMLVVISTIAVIANKTAKSKFLNYSKPDLIIASINTRLDIWEKSIAMGIDNFLTGVGPRCYQLSFNYEEDINRKKYGIPPDYGTAHNTFINVFAETGIIGLVGFLIWIANYLCITIKSKKNTFESFVLKNGAAGFLILFFIIGITEAVEGLTISFLAGALIAALLRANEF
ncbi:MAG: O-antigen ligase family protein [bacterium]|nr:O-antigen ligase family protein [bacterium]